jgi:protein TonB
MKRIILLSVVLFLNVSVFAQKDTSNTKIIPTETLPEFPGGPAKFAQFIQKNLKYPSDAWNNSIKGTVQVQFTIDTDGSVVPESVKVIRSLSESCDLEAIRIVKKSPKWIPGYQNGKAVRVGYSFPVTFKL